jgi:hypothetical protein
MVEIDLYPGQELEEVSQRVAQGYGSSVISVKQIPLK